jgi:hypothetical protein
VASNGLGSGSIIVTPRPTFWPMCGHSKNIRPAPLETFDFVVSQGGRKLSLIFTGTAQMFGGDYPVGNPFNTWMDGEAERQDSPCEDENPQTYLPPARRLDTLDR